MNIKSWLGLDNEVERMTEMADTLKEKGFAIVPIEPTEPIIREMQRIGARPKDWKSLLLSAGSI